MKWIIIIALAIPLGWFVSLITRRYGMGAIVCVPIAVLGAAMGGALDRILFEAATPAYTFYALSLLLSVAALGGGTFAFLLTSSERRA
ncbi:MAG: hypothetical protein NDI61_04745 [Bdellovibrionaceae bacterium]|nr:hypothetical protein [Pseudobdellovibrionaceae bacterium]